MMLLDKIRYQIKYILEQLECLKEKGCLCYSFETDLTYDSETGELSATFVDDSTRTVTIDIPEVTTGFGLSIDDNEAIRLGQEEELAPGSGIFFENVPIPNDSFFGINYPGLGAPPDGAAMFMMNKPSLAAEDSQLTLQTGLASETRAAGIQMNSGSDAASTQARIIMQVAENAGVSSISLRPNSVTISPSLSVYGTASGNDPVGPSNFVTLGYLNSVLEPPTTDEVENLSSVPGTNTTEALDDLQGQLDILEQDAIQDLQSVLDEGHTANINSFNNGVVLSRTLSSLQLLPNESTFVRYTNTDGGFYALGQPAATSPRRLQIQTPRNPDGTGTDSLAKLLLFAGDNDSAASKPNFLAAEVLGKMAGYPAQANNEYTTLGQINAALDDIDLQFVVENGNTSTGFNIRVNGDTSGEFAEINGGTSPHFTFSKGGSQLYTIGPDATNRMTFVTPFSTGASSGSAKIKLYNVDNTNTTGDINALVLEVLGRTKGQPAQNPNEYVTLSQLGSGEIPLGFGLSYNATDEDIQLGTEQSYGKTFHSVSIPSGEGLMLGDNVLDPISPMLQISREDSGQSSLLMESGGSTGYSQIIISNDSTQRRISFTVSDTGNKGIEISSNNNGIRVIDDINNLGLVGDIDFSPSYVDNSYIQKTYFDNNIALVQDGNGYQLVTGGTKGILGTNATDLSIATAFTNRGASGTESFAFGSDTLAQGNRSLAGGYRSQAIGHNSIAIGGSTTIASGSASMSLLGQVASGDDSVVIGDGSNASGQNAFATGASTLAAGRYSFTMGWQTISNAAHCLTLGRWNDPIITTPETAMVDGSPIFIIGNGFDDPSRTNSIVMYNDGAAEFKGAITTLNPGGTSSVSLQPGSLAGNAILRITNTSGDSTDIYNTGTGLTFDTPDGSGTSPKVVILNGDNSTPENFIAANVNGKITCQAAQNPNEAMVLSQAGTPSQGTIGPAIPAVLAYITATQSIPDDTSTAVSWDAVSYDQFSMHNGTTGFVVPTWASYAKVTVKVQFDSNGTGTGRGTFTQLNGGEVIGMGYTTKAPSSDANNSNVIGYTSGVFPVTSGDVITNMVHQDSGGALNLVPGANNQRCFIQIELYESI